MSTPALRNRITHHLEAAGLSISSIQSEQLAAYCELLQHWQKTINLTALPLSDFPDSTLQKLIVEPLAIASGIENKDLIWLDLGSGGGSPAVPLKIVRPASRLTMVESRSRKCAFLREVVRSLGLLNTLVLSNRFEELADHRLDAELITVRALKTDRRFFEVVNTLLATSGRLAVFGSTIPPNGAPLQIVCTEELEVPGVAVHWFVRT